MIRKLKLLWKLLDRVEQQGDDLVIHVDGNLRLAVDGHLVHDVSKSCLIKTGTEEGHLLYLNPVTEHSLSDNVEGAIQQSSASHHAAMTRLSKRPE